MTPDEIRAARWFRSKQRAIAAVESVDHAPLGDAGAALTVLEVRFADGGMPERYLVPTVDRREPNDGEGAWRAVVRAIAAGDEIVGEHGSFRASSTRALDELLPSPAQAVEALDERRLRVEQSNTSIVLGSRLILKIYRLLEPGQSPDLEISRFLTGVGFAGTPSVAGSLTYRAADGTVSAAAMLQEYVASVGDGWSAMLATLATDASAGLAMAARIGGVTAELHAALASRPDDPAFPARPATAAESAAWRASAERQLAQAVTAVDGDAHERLVALAPRATARFADTFGRASGDATVTRIHGDYHLGQLLARSDGSFSVIDFEGEPARPLPERREPGSPLRDVAGMLRSLDYAARTTEAGHRHPAAFGAEPWLAEARASFLGGYGGTAAHGSDLLDAFELEKACYEVRYEASNRPDWLWLPLAAVERILARSP